jgi:integrase
MDSLITAAARALAALTFLYDHVVGVPLGRVDAIARARQGQRVPVVLSQHEVRAILARLRDPVRLCAQLMYGSGLRVVECVTLRVKDVDLDRCEIVVRDGKGGKDRRTPLARAAVPRLRAWLRDRERLPPRSESVHPMYRACPGVAAEVSQR